MLKNTKSYYLPKVITVMSHFNRLQDSIECLNSLSNQDYPNNLILVVDNGSNSGDAETIKKSCPGCYLVRLPKNQGFAGGYNAGIQEAITQKADFIFIISNDTILNSNVISLLVEALESTNAGAAAPLIYYFSQPDKIWSAGGSINSFSLHMTDNHGRKKTFTSFVERDFITGCAIIFRKNVLLDVGGFDEQYFCFFEDMDLSVRIKKRGHSIILVPDSIIWHKVSLSYSGTSSPQERNLMARGYILFLKKHLSVWKRVFIAPFMLYVYIKNVFILIKNCKLNSIIAYHKGFIEGIYLPLENRIKHFNN